MLRLRKCPKCKCDDVEICEEWIDSLHVGWYYAKCPKCKYRSYCKPSAEEAVTAWNRRLIFKNG